MNIKLLMIGKTDSEYLVKGFDEYVRRTKRFINFTVQIIPDIRKGKKLSQAERLASEGELIMAAYNAGDYVVLLDEHGKEFSSVQFADFIQKQLNSGLKNMVFTIGGPYGFSPQVKQRADVLISLSKMTFSHQMVRLLFAEQLYRAFSILNGLPYHHE
jgi:23S rRNA (pseudouridine1915-N3)-methyltransferase